MNRISKDKFGNDLSRISVNAEALASMDSQERNDLETCSNIGMGKMDDNKSQYKTEAS